MNKSKILFLSHTYPPVLGGVENQNFNLARSLSEISDVRIIANGRGKKNLPFFIPRAFLKSFFLMSGRDFCLVGSGVLAPVAAVLKFFHPRKKFFSVVHGLDLTFVKKKGFLPKIYSLINIPSLKKMDKLFAVGNFALKEAEKIGVPPEKTVFIPNGTEVVSLKKEFSREDLDRVLEMKTEKKKIILRLARFVPHKGTDWFIKEVMPGLSSDVVLIAAGHRVGKNTAGDPDNFEDCQKAVSEKQLEDRVRLLPSLPQKDLEVLLNTVDMVVSPNIEYPGSSEGFGINVIEAGACERVVLASDLQGLSDAVKNGKNGFLLEPGNAEQWVKKIEAVFSAGTEFSRSFGKMAGEYVRENYDWKKIARRYLEEMEKPVSFSESR